MTEAQQEARKKSAESGKIRWIKDHCLRTKDGNDPYVFISYKSDDYEQVLEGIVYEVCRKYNLRVYFDTAFDDESESWIKQFYGNMCNVKCKAMVAFISNKYYSSYATLLEMMARMTRKAGGDMKFDSLPFVPINLEDIVDIKSEKNTGLGTERFSDAKINKQAGTELKLFNKIFKEITDDRRLRELKYIYDRESDSELYEEKTADDSAHGDMYLNETQCRAIMKKVCPDNNNNDGRNKDFVEVIHDKLKHLTGVFGPPIKPDDEIEGGGSGPIDPDGPGTPPSPDPEPLTDTITFKDFLKKYNNNNFKKGTFTKFRLVGKDRYADYTTEFYDSSFDLTWDFVMKILKEKGEEYIHFVNGKNSEVKNPPFITKEDHEARKAGNNPVTYRQIELPGLSGYSMNRHYGQYGWVDQVLRRRMMELGLPLDAFFFEYVKDGAGDILPPAVEEGGDDKTGNQGKETGSTDGGSVETYCYQKARITYDARKETFTILSGSLIKAEPTSQRSKSAGLMEVYTNYLKSGKLKPSQRASGYMEVLEDMPAGSSPSGAAKMVSGNSVNGNLALTEINSKKNFGQLHGAGESGASGTKTNAIDDEHKFGLGGIV